MLFRFQLTKPDILFINILRAECSIHLEANLQIQRGRISVKDIRISTRLRGAPLDACWSVFCAPLFETCLFPKGSLTLFFARLKKIYGHLFSVFFRGLAQRFFYDGPLILDLDQVRDFFVRAFASTAVRWTLRRESWGGKYLFRGFWDGGLIVLSTIWCWQTIRHRVECIRKYKDTQREAYQLACFQIQSELCVEPLIEWAALKTAKLTLSALFYTLFESLSRIDFTTMIIDDNKSIYDSLTLICCV